MSRAALIGVVSLVVPTAAFSLEVPPADSPAAAYLQVDAAIERAQILQIASLQPAIEESRNACARSESVDPCAPERIRRCQAGLASLFDRSQEARANADPLLAASLARATATVGGAITRLAHLPAPGGSCASQPPRVGARRATVVPSPDARFVEVHPLVPLRAGRRYWVVLEGRPASWGGAPGEPRVVSSSETGATETGFPSSLGGIDRERLADFLDSMAQAQAGLPGATGFAGVRLRLPAAAGGTDLAGMRASFVPAHTDEPQEAVTSVTVGDPRTGLLDYRSRLRAGSCPDGEIPLAAAPVPPKTPPGTTAYQGQLASLDLGVNRPASGPLGVPAAEAAETEIGFRLLLPPDPTPETPLVLVLDGHMGSVDRMFERHAAELLTDGMAVVGIDLPEHGARATPERDFVTPFDPMRLSRSMRQAATDVMAAVRQAVDCGFHLGGSVHRPSRVRFLGYSLGAMVGSIARSVEPDLGTTALVAPGGDLIGWLMLRLGPGLGAQYVTCVGGAEHGETCIEDGLCAAPGTCAADPFFELLYQRIALPYSLASGAGDPLSFATERTGPASHGPLLLITGGEDPALHPALAARLADAYGMRVTGPYQRRGPRSRYVQWPALAHDLPDHEGPRRQAHRFLATDGRELLPTAIEKASPKPAWYSVFAPHRDRR